MNFDEKKINDKKLEDLFEKVKEGDADLTGKYIYKNMRIIIMPKTPYTNKERVMRQYYKKRAKGLCIKCGKKIQKINPRTKNLYRYCDYHRNAEKEYRKMKRQQSKFTT